MRRLVALVVVAVACAAPSQRRYAGVRCPNAPTAALLAAAALPAGVGAARAMPRDGGQDAAVLPLVAGLVVASVMEALAIRVALDGCYVEPPLPPAAAPP